jgi:Arf-GAP/coiled-coil/ANK repeat/PH domain-containing protein
VKVWEPVIIDLFRALGNDYNNSIWEALLPKEDQGYVDISCLTFILSISHPSHTSIFKLW